MSRWEPGNFPLSSFIKRLILCTSMCIRKLWSPSNIQVISMKLPFWIVLQNIHFSCTSTTLVQDHFPSHEPSFLNPPFNFSYLLLFSDSLLSPSNAPNTLQRRKFSKKKIKSHQSPLPRLLRTFAPTASHALRNETNICTEPSRPLVILPVTRFNSFHIPSSLHSKKNHLLWTCQAFSSHHGEFALQLTLPENTVFQINLGHFDGL